VGQMHLFIESQAPNLTLSCSAAGANIPRDMMHHAHRVVD